MMGPNHPDNSKNQIGLDSIRRKSSRPETLCGKSHIPWDGFYAIPVAPGPKNNSKSICLTDFRDLGYSGIFPIILSLRCSLQHACTAQCGLSMYPRLPNFTLSENVKMEHITPLSWQIWNLGKIRVPRINPSRQVSMSVACAGL